MPFRVTRSSLYSPASLEVDGMSFILSYIFVRFTIFLAWLSEFLLNRKSTRALIKGF